MFLQKLIALGSSLLITGGTLFAMAAFIHTSRHAPLPATIDGLSITDLPGMVVRPGVTATNTPGHDAAYLFEEGRNSVIDTASRLASPSLRMPYYSFGSASLRILEKD